MRRAYVLNVVILFFSGFLLLMPSALLAAGRTYQGDPAGRSLSRQTSLDVQKRIEKLQAKIITEGSVRIIVGLRVPFAPEGTLSSSEVSVQRREIAAAASAFRGLFSPDFFAKRGAFLAYESIPYVAVEASSSDFDRIIRYPDSISIQEDELNYPNLAQSTSLVGATQAWSSGYTGNGKVVAILDSGVDKNHTFLLGKVVTEACYSRGGFCPGGTTSSTATGSGVNCPLSYSGCDHGTHVAGIAAGLGSSYSGVAKGANIMAIQVFSPSGTSIGAYDSDYIAGLQRVLNLHNAGSYSFASANLSLGSGGYTSACDSSFTAIKSAIDNLRSVGIATVIASGNSSYTNAISKPACISTAISVGSTWDASGYSLSSCSSIISAVDSVACYSNSASFLKLLAPGSIITSSVPNGGYAAWNGTSMAAPHVTGAWAVIKEKAPAATVDQVLNALQTTGTSVTDYRNNIKIPRISVNAALGQFSGTSYSVSVAKTGTGSGTVVSSQPGINCGTTCSAAFASGSVLNLTATAPTGSTFSMWSGGCSGSSPTCTINNLSATTAVQATFVAAQTYSLSYTKAGTGSGTVTSSPSGLNCSASCSVLFNSGTAIVLTATPGSSSIFSGWSGCDTVSGTTCSVTMSSAKSVTATFSPTPTVTLQSGVPLSGLSGVTGSSSYFSFTIPTGATGFTVTTSGGFGDADLYVRAGTTRPTLSRYSCRSISTTSTESCTFTGTSGTYSIMIYGYAAYNSVTLTATAR